MHTGKKMKSILFNRDTFGAPYKQLKRNGEKKKEKEKEQVERSNDSEQHGIRER